MNQDQKNSNDNAIAPTNMPEFDFTKTGNSGMDCTGSVPRPPESDAELDSYLDVYNFLPQSALLAAQGKAVNDIM